MSEAFPNSNQDEQEYKVTKIPGPTEEEMDAIRKEAGTQEYVGEKQMGNGPDYEGNGFQANGNELSSDDADTEVSPAEEDAINKALGDAALEGVKEEQKEDEGGESAV